MTFSLRRSHRAFVRCASVTLALLTMIALIAPRAVLSAPAPMIVSVDVTGNVHVPSDKILAILEAKKGVAYDPKLVSDDIARLNALGYFADVAAPEVRARPDGIAITYRVVENPVITKILFTGNANVPSDTLLALMDTSVGQVLNSNTLKQDVLKINNYYQQIGYSGLPTNVIDLKIDANSGMLSFSIREGFTIRKVNITGDHLLAPTVILPVLNVRPGIVYSDQLRDKDNDVLKTLYDKFDLLQPDFTGGIDPTSIDLKNGTADVTYNINVLRVAVVQITGNTKTKDAVVRRELRLRPGMIITNGALKRDYERLNATGYFSKVDITPKPGLDPKHPELIVLDWNVTEQKTAQAQVGFGYSGGITGQGLYGTLGFSDNNLHGTGNGLSLQLQQGARNSQTQLQVTVPYLGNTPKTQRYGFSGTIFSNKTTYYYPAYGVNPTGAIVAAPSVGGTPAPIPVTLYSNGNTAQVSGLVATSSAASAGVSAQLSRRVSDYTQLSLAGSVQRITNDTTVPAPYFFQGGQPNVLVGPTPNPLGSSLSTNNGSFGITASSIANVNTGTPYRLTDLTFGATTDTRDDPYNPSRGMHASITELFSDPSIGSSFRFTQSALDVSKFFPFRTGTIALHGLGESTTGAIPPNQLYTFSDSQIRGYNTVFYGTDAFLGQAEFRQPVTPDRKLYAAIFVDQLAYKIRGATPLLDPYTNRIIGYPADWSERFDYGFGIRFDVPQLNLHTVRIDIARGKDGTHTSFGIGQSF
jgi:outer membrane protein insertion porin family